MRCGPRSTSNVDAREGNLFVYNHKNLTHRAGFGTRYKEILR